MGLLDVELIKNAQKGLPEDYISAHWMDKDAKGFSLFAHAIIKKNQPVIRACLNNPYLSDMVELDTTFLLAACYLDAETFSTLLSYASPLAISTALFKKGANGWTALSIAARYQKADEFIKLIDRVYTTAIDIAVVRPTNAGYTALHLAARHQTQNAFNTFIEKMSPEIINQVIPMLTHDNETVLHIALRHQQPFALSRLIAATSDATVSTVLPLLDYEGKSILYLAASLEDGSLFYSLVQKGSQEAIDEALVKTHYKGRTVLHEVIEHQRAHCLSKLIEKALPSVISSILVMLTHPDCQPLSIPSSDKWMIMFKFIDTACEGKYNKYEPLAMPFMPNYAVRLVYALKNRFFNITKALLEREHLLNRGSLKCGSNRVDVVNERDGNQKTPVEYTIEYGLKDMFMQLVDLGAALPGQKSAIDYITELFEEACLHTHADKMKLYSSWLQDLTKPKPVTAVVSHSYSKGRIQAVTEDRSPLTDRVDAQVKNMILMRQLETV